MRAVIQRVKEASVIINQMRKESIEGGLLVFLGIEETDNQEDIDWLCGKIVRLRIFGDSKGLMNLSVREVHGEIMVISQFTLHASTKKGNRPSFIKAARPDIALKLYHQFITTLGQMIEAPVRCGEFGADMQVQLINDGPVTILIDTKNKE